VEVNSRRITELESVQNNVRLLSDMLDQYQLGQTSAEELELIKELHQSCERLRPSVFRLASETQDNESVLSEYNRFGKCEDMSPPPITEWEYGYTILQNSVKISLTFKRLLYMSNVIFQF
jgi:hypothetical protein